MGESNLYLGDPWISSPLQNLDKVLCIPSGSKNKERKCVEKLIVLCTQNVSYLI